MEIKSLCCNVCSPVLNCKRFISSKTSSLAMRDYEDDDSEEVSKGRFLVGTEDVIDVDEVSKCREGIPGWKATPTENNSHAADGSPMPRAHCSQVLSTSPQTPSLSSHKTVCTLLEYKWSISTLFVTRYLLCLGGLLEVQYTPKCELDLLLHTSLMYGFIMQQVIVIVRLVCDMVQTQHESQGRKAPEGECCVCTISHAKCTMTIIFSVTMAP